MKSFNFINNYIFTISDEFNDILAVDTIPASAKFHYWSMFLILSK